MMNPMTVLWDSWQDTVRTCFIFPLQSIYEDFGENAKIYRRFVVHPQGVELLMAASAKRGGDSRGFFDLSPLY
jgi:hypothetical protein